MTRPCPHKQLPFLPNIDILVNLFRASQELGLCDASPNSAWAGSWDMVDESSIYTYPLLVENRSRDVVFAQACNYVRGALNGGVLAWLGKIQRREAVRAMFSASTLWIAQVLVVGSWANHMPQLDGLTLKLLGHPQVLILVMELCGATVRGEKAECRSAPFPGCAFRSSSTACSIAALAFNRRFNSSIVFCSLG